MTREVKKPEIRRNEILDTAQKFFYQKGYEQTSIQDIIDNLDIAKGTFYHYFTSKIDMLDQLVDRTTSEISAALKQIADSNLHAIEKFNAFFRAATVMKMQRLDVFLVMLKVMFKDENTIIRVKMYRRMVEKNAHLFSTIIKQGIDENIFNTQFPDDVGELLMQVGSVLNETVCRLLIKKDEDPNDIVKMIETKMKLYQDAMERILGAPRGSLQIYAPQDYGDIVTLFYQKLREDKGNEGKYVE
jgi:AcrR family transcriptional regulator